MKTPMSPRARIILTIASLVLLLSFVFPLWKITLEAPQYPEGIGMYIQINDVTGVEKHDLRNINGLNHYIGMKEIHPETIPELKIMPFAVMGLLALGLLSAAIGKKWLAWIWVGVFLVAIIAGMIDFWLWEYDYGHDLNPKAAISIPGMNYQPPLIGSKKLLNFTAHSWPALGGWAVFSSFVAGVVAVELDRRSSKKAG
jgi:copper chaperone NosL